LPHFSGIAGEPMNVRLTGNLGHRNVPERTQWIVSLRHGLQQATMTPSISEMHPQSSTKALTEISILTG
jgi:hypothetical protein